LDRRQTTAMLRNKKILLHWWYKFNAIVSIKANNLNRFSLLAAVVY